MDFPIDQIWGGSLIALVLADRSIDLPYRESSISLATFKYYRSPRHEISIFRESLSSLAPFTSLSLSLGAPKGY